MIEKNFFVYQPAPVDDLEAGAQEGWVIVAESDKIGSRTVAWPVVMVNDGDGHGFCQTVGEAVEGTLTDS